MGRLPIRIRLTLAFAVVMALVLAATGAFLYLRLGSGLARAVDQGLQARATDIAALAQQADTGLREAGRRPGLDSGVAQVVGPGGEIVDATSGLARRPLLTLPQLARAGHRASYFGRELGGERVRLLAVPVTAQDRSLVVVVGASLEPRAAALADLRTQLLVGGPVALLLASLAGYLLATAALRPVEAMGRRAASISGAQAGRRLPVPRADDELARLGGRLNEMLERLEAALEREQNLVANASHELRTPLALMKTEIELALAEPDSAPALAAALRSAGDETDRLAQLADDLLLLARVDSGTLPIRRAPVAVAELLEAIAVRFQRRAQDAGRELETAAPPDLVVLADRRRLEQALANLVENALRHGRGAITLEAAEAPGGLELRVTDRGQGFPPDFIARAFERFSRGDDHRSGGAGLGLAIVAAVAHAHGGEAAAANVPAGGATVSLTVPLVPAAVAPVRKPPRRAGSPA